MKPIILTKQNITTVYDRIKKYLSRRKGLLNVVTLPKVYTFKNAHRLSALGPKTIVRNYLDHDYYRGAGSPECVGIIIGHRFELEIPDHEFMVIGDKVWITPQGIFIKTWRGLYETPQFIVIKGELGVVEVLTYSKKQLHCMADRPEKWDEGSMVHLSFYGDKQFTNRVLKGEEISPWEDAEIVYIGVVDDSGLSVEEVGMYDVYKDTEPDSEEMNPEKEYTAMRS